MFCLFAVVLIMMAVFFFTYFFIYICYRKMWNSLQDLLTDQRVSFLDFYRKTLPHGTCKKYYPHLNSTTEFSYRKGVKLKLYKVFRKKTSKFYFSLKFYTVYSLFHCKYTLTIFVGKGFPYINYPNPNKV